jgi:hypothetical protein
MINNQSNEKTKIDDFIKYITTTRDPTKLYAIEDKKELVKNINGLDSIFEQYKNISEKINYYLQIRSSKFQIKRKDTSYKHRNVYYDVSAIMYRYLDFYIIKKILTYYYKSSNRNGAIRTTCRYEPIRELIIFYKEELSIFTDFMNDFMKTYYPHNIKRPNNSNNQSIGTTETIRINSYNRPIGNNNKINYYPIS